MELAADLGINGGEKVKVSSARATYKAKAMVTQRIKPMMIDGKKVYQIGIPIHLRLSRHSGRCGQNRHASSPTRFRPR